MLPRAKFRRPKSFQVHEGIFAAKLYNHKTDKRYRGGPGKLGDPRIAEPILPVSVIEHDLEEKQARSPSSLSPTSHPS
jgi:hypothetical protein